MDLQHIQWFPGHMTKAFRMMEDNLALCDGVIFVVDSRAPFACENKRLCELFRNKPILYVFNKSDLIAPSDKTYLLEKYKEQGKTAVASVGTDARGCKEIYPAFAKLLKDKIDRAAAKGVTKTIRAMVAGVPNTGKSSVINALCGKKSTATGDKAGVTRGKQWVKLNGFELLDTPGTMPPSVENNIYALDLALIGCLNDSLLDMGELALELIKILCELCPECFIARYAIDCIGKTPVEILSEICKKRGCLLKGGECDNERGGQLLIDDFRKGRLGRICLEGKRREAKK